LDEVSAISKGVGVQSLVGGYFCCPTSGIYKTLNLQRVISATFVISALIALSMLESRDEAALEHP
jgi:aspartate/methionine/tyrosine aminotransferase